MYKTNEMNKPTLFLSHNSNDAAPLKILKQMLLEKTNGDIEIFLSSDGQSITAWL